MHISSIVCTLYLSYLFNPISILYTYSYILYSAIHTYTYIYIYIQCYRLNEQVLEGNQQALLQMMRDTKIAVNDIITIQQERDRKQREQDEQVRG